MAVTSAENSWIHTLDDEPALDARQRDLAHVALGGEGMQDHAVGDLARDLGHQVADRGEHGGSNNCHGKDGKDIEIRVPCGTLVYSGGELIADLSDQAIERIHIVAPKDADDRGGCNFAWPRVAQHGRGHPQLRLALQRGQVLSSRFVEDFVELFNQHVIHR